jgi:WD40 repeat protein
MHRHSERALVRRASENRFDEMDASDDDEPVDYNETEAQHPVLPPNAAFSLDDTYVAKTCELASSLNGTGGNGRNGHQIYWARRRYLLQSRAQTLRKFINKRGVVDTEDMNASQQRISARLGLGFVDIEGTRNYLETRESILAWRLQQKAISIEERRVNAAAEKQVKQAMGRALRAERSQRALFKRRSSKTGMPLVNGAQHRGLQVHRSFTLRGGNEDGAGVQIICVRFSPRPMVLRGLISYVFACGCADGTLALCEVRSEKASQDELVTSLNNAVRGKPKHREGANADASGERQPTSHCPVRYLRGHTKAVTALSWAASGELLVSVSNDMTARVWSCAHMRGGGNQEASGFNGNNDPGSENISTEEEMHCEFSCIRTVYAGSTGSASIPWTVCEICPANAGLCVLGKGNGAGNGAGNGPRTGVQPSSGNSSSKNTTGSSTTTRARSASATTTRVRAASSATAPSSSGFCSLYTLDIASGKTLSSVSLSQPAVAAVADGGSASCGSDSSGSASGSAGLGPTGGSGGSVGVSVGVSNICFDREGRTLFVADTNGSIHRFTVDHEHAQQTQQTPHMISSQGQLQEGLQGHPQQQQKQHHGSSLQGAPPPRILVDHEVVYRAKQSVTQGQAILTNLQYVAGGGGTRTTTDTSWHPLPSP